MSTGNLYAALKAAFPADTAATCLELPDGRTFSYGDMDRGSSRIAGCLRDQGVSPGDRVMVQVEKSPEAWRLAILRVLLEPAQESTPEGIFELFLD